MCVCVCAPDASYVGLLTTVALAPVVLVMVASSTVSLSAIPRQVYLIILLEGEPAAARMAASVL